MPATKSEGSGLQRSTFSKRSSTLKLTLAVLLIALPGAPPSAFAQSVSNSGQEMPAEGIELINNRHITPAGRQTELGDLPLNAVLSPDGHYLLVTNSGAGIQSLEVIDTDSSRVVQTVSYAAPNSVFVGLAYSPDGSRAYAAGGGFDVVHTYSADSQGALAETGDIPIGNRQDNPFPTGLSVSPDGSRLYVANNLANTVAVVDTSTRQVVGNVPVGAYPYTTLTSRDGSRVYVSNWGEASISVIDTPTATVAATIPVGEHPSAMIAGPGNLLYVADTNSDAVSVVDTAAGRELRRLSTAAYPGAALGTSPEGLALSPDGKTLYVAEAGHNDVAVFHVDAAGERLVGRIPTAWYPTAVVASTDGRRLFVTNAKGVGAGRNSAGLYPNPTRPSVPFQEAIGGYADAYCQCTFNNYSGSMILGTLSSLEVPQAGRLSVYSDQVARNNRDQAADSSERSDDNPIPVPGGKSPIQHVIYVIKENRTFDQVFGDESIGDTDANLTLFGRSNTPNMHALAERFGLLDNFHADAEVSADGHNWATSANASDYNQKMWPQDYSPGAGRNRGYDFEGGSRINLSAGGYLWDAAADAGISYRDYGEFYQFDGNYPAASAKLIPDSGAATCDGPIARSYTGMAIPAGQVLCFLPMQINPQTTPALVDHIDARFRTYDLRYRETDRIAEFQREFDGFVANRNLPALEILRLPNDHTAGTKPGSPTPQAMLAENDFALGKLVEIVSTSPYWATTAVFVTEDDAQNGPDHVDAHRTTSFVISPYTSQASPRVEHGLYDTAAMVRTIELILGLRPLSQFDADAMPMWQMFSSRPDTTPYFATAENIPITDTNAPNAVGATESIAMDFSEEDRTPMDALNAILWHAVKGADVPYPGTQSDASPHSTPGNAPADEDD